MTRLLMDEEPITIPRALPSVVYNGATIGINAAHFIQQVHYYTIKNEANYLDGEERAIEYQRDAAWWAAAEQGWWQRRCMPWVSVRTFQRFVSKLREPCGFDGDYGLLIVGNFSTDKGHKKNWYRVNHLVFEVHLNSWKLGIPVENYAAKVAATIGDDDILSSYYRQNGGIPPIYIETSRDDFKTRTREEKPPKPIPDVGSMMSDLKSQLGA